MRSSLLFWFQLEVNDRKVELIDDALGGFSILNCIEACEEGFQLSSRKSVVKSNHMNSMATSTRSSVESDTIIPSKKYAFDVVDDSTDNRIDVDKRIVRVSLQKSARSQGACFKGNESYALYDFGRVFKSTERLQNIVNIRFKTSSLNGLMFLISQKLSNQFENYFSLSIEDG
jgi:hypothetical protein